MTKETLELVCTILIHDIVLVNTILTNELILGIAVVIVLVFAGIGALFGLHYKRKLHPCFYRYQTGFVIMLLLVVYLF